MAMQNIDQQRSIYDRWNDDTDMFQNLHINDEYTYDIFPLGKLSKKQILKGEEVLNEINNVIEHSYNNTNQLINLSNRFYSIIPHLSEYINLINNYNILEEKYKLIKYMKSC